MKCLCCETIIKLLAKIVQFFNSSVILASPGLCDWVLHAYFRARFHCFFFFLQVLTTLEGAILATFFDLYENVSIGFIS